jgi:hypothetical protein
MNPLSSGPSSSGSRISISALLSWLDFRNSAVALLAFAARSARPTAVAGADAKVEDRLDRRYRIAALPGRFDSYFEALFAQVDPEFPMPIRPPLYLSFPVASVMPGTVAVAAVSHGSA